MRGSWSDETVRLLQNWALWIQSGRRAGESTIGPFPAYRMASRGKRAANVIPILGVDAEKSDRIIEALPPRYSMPLRMHYCWTLRADRSKADSCNCSVNTYKARLNEAHSMFESAWYGRSITTPASESA